MSAVSISSRKMPWQTKAQRGTVLTALAIKREIVKARLVRIREDEGHPEKPGKPLTVEDAAARAGVKYRTWQRWEAGESIPYARNLAAIADAFEFDVAEFYDDSGDKAGTPSPFNDDLATPASRQMVTEMFEAIEQRVTSQLDRHAREVEAQLQSQNTTLSEMKATLAEIRAEQVELRQLIAEQRSLNDGTEELRRLAREIVTGRPTSLPDPEPARERQ
jgi:transcriptional regulator with XRE-family HTH domain